MLGENAIKEMVKNNIRERRRSFKDQMVYCVSSATEQESASSSSESQSPPNVHLQQKKNEKYEGYFHAGELIAMDC